MIFERMCGERRSLFLKAGTSANFSLPTPPPSMFPCLYTWLSGIHAKRPINAKPSKIRSIHPSRCGTDFKCNIKIRGVRGLIPPAEPEAEPQRVRAEPHHPSLAYCPLCADVLGVLVRSSVMT